MSRVTPFAVRAGFQWFASHPQRIARWRPKPREPQIVVLDDIIANSVVRGLTGMNIDHVVTHLRSHGYRLARIQK